MIEPTPVTNIITKSHNLSLISLTQHAAKRGADLHLGLKGLDLHHGLGPRLELPLVQVTPVILIPPVGQLVILQQVLIA